MSAEGEAYSITNILSGFTSAESVAEDVVEQILAEGGRLLYQAYIEKKSFSFGSQAISNVLVGELNMCFVRHDAGEPVLPLAAGANRGSDRWTSSGALASTVRPVVCACGNMFMDDAQFCRKCGEARKPETERQACPCGNVFKDDSQFCRKCGEARKVGREAEAQALVLEARPLPPPLDLSESPTAGEAAPSAAPAARASPVESIEEREVSCFSWALEAEPVPCRIDTWARACVPVRRTLVRPKTKAMPSDKKTPSGSASVRGKKHSQSRSMSDHKGGPMSPTSPKLEELAKDPKNNGMIPLVETVEHDEEESAMREMKEREAKRKREEENRIHRKVTEEAEEAARLAQVKDQMKNKPYTYDSAGNIIWVTPFAAEKLPSATPIPSYVLRREMVSAEEQMAKSAAVKEPRDLRNKAKGKVKEHEFVDTFKKFSSQQPPMMETMTMAAGVRLRERGAVKKGEDIISSSDAAMTRAKYEALVQSGGAGYPKDKDEGKEEEKAEKKEISAPAPPGGGDASEPAGDRGGGESAAQKDNPHRGSAMANGLRGGVKAVRPESPAGGGMVPRAPSEPRPEQPVPPSSYRRVQMKQAALGYNMSTRERVPTGQGSRFPGCAAAPVLGAVMGHGLIPQGSKYEEYYFPHAAGLPLGIPDEDAAWPPSPHGSSVPVSPRPHDHGNLVSKNPELVKRLFNR